MNEIPSIQWEYPLVDITEDKSTTRVGVQPGSAYECVGADGNDSGGLRPFPGFVQVGTLGLPGLETWTNADEVTDCFYVEFIYGGTVAYGWVYRVNGTKVYLQWKLLDDALWQAVEYLCSGTADAVMSVTTLGRFVFVGVSGLSPVLIYKDPASTALRIVTSPGPGQRPRLIRSSKATYLGGMGSTLGTRPAAGQIVLTDIPPSLNGLSTGQPDEADTRLNAAASLEPGDYAFAYMLYDSQTGRKSALSDVALARYADFPVGGSSGSEAGVAQGQYAVLELYYDATKFDQVYIYRSVMTENAGGTFTAGFLWLDRIATLSTYHGGVQPLDPTYNHSYYYYTLEDKQLPFQDLFTDRTLYDEVVPYGGALVVYEGTLVVTKLANQPLSGAAESDEPNRVYDTIVGLGEIRYSSLVDVSLELFPPQNRYTPAVPSSEIIVWQLAGDNLLGFAYDRQYLVRKESVSLRVQEMHQGFGIAGPRASEVVGSLVYFLTPKGLKTVGADGSLEDVRSLNTLVMDEWGPSLTGVCLAYDAQMSALFLLNPTTMSMAILWFNNARVTELYDTNCSVAFRGRWPLNGFSGYDGNSSTPADYTSPLVDRAFFVVSPDQTNGNSPRVYVTDSQRSQKVAGGAATYHRATLFPVASSAFCTTTGSTFVGNPLQLTTAILGSEGLFLYVLDSTTPSLIGRKARIVSTIGPGQQVNLYTGDEANFANLPAGSRLGLSPVYFRWTGHPLGVQDETGQDFGGKDFFRVRQADSLSCAFSNVSGLPLDPNNVANLDHRYKGLMYKGTSATAASTGVPRTTAGAKVASIVEGEGSDYVAFGTGQETTNQGRYGVNGSALTPSVEIHVPNLDFRLLEVLVLGTMKATFRTRRAT